MFVKINLAVRYVLAFTLMYCSCLSISAMEQVDDTVDFSAPKFRPMEQVYDTVDFSEPKFTVMEQVDDTVDFSAPEYCPEHPKDLDKFCVMTSRIDCIKKYIEKPSKYYDDIKICAKEIKEINSQKHEEHSSGRSMSHPNYMTPVEKDDLQRRINCMTKHIKEASKCYDGEKEIKSQKHEEHSSGRSMSPSNYMTPMEQDDDWKNERMRLSYLCDIWGCCCEHYNDEVDKELNKLKEEFEEEFEEKFEKEFGEKFEEKFEKEFGEKFEEKFKKNKIYYLINAVKKLKEGRKLNRQLMPVLN